MSTSNALVQKLWNYCNVLRDDGLSYGDYVEQLTFLLFLKMADEQSRPPFNKPSAVPKGFGWDVLVKLDGDDLETHYRHTLEELGKRKGMLGIIFRKAQNKIQDPAKLRRLIVDLIDKEQWSSLSADVKANVLFFDRKPAQEKPWTDKLWIYDLRTNLHFTLKESTLERSDLDDFVACYNPKNRTDRQETDRFKSFTYAELAKRDKVNLDIFWLKDDALEESANLPAPGVIAQEIADDLETALEQFATIANDLK